MIRKNRDVCLLGMPHRKPVHSSDLQMNKSVEQQIYIKKKTDLKRQFVQICLIDAEGLRIFCPKITYLSLCVSL